MEKPWVGLMLCTTTNTNMPSVLEVPGKSLPQDLRPHDSSVLRSLAAPNGNLAPIEVEIRDAELDALLDTQTGAIEQRRDKTKHATCASAQAGATGGSRTSAEADNEEDTKKITP
jgi:hypothetical protein